MLLLTHKVEFARVSPYIIADYVNEVQKVTLKPKVKVSICPKGHYSRIKFLKVKGVVWF